MNNKGFLGMGALGFILIALLSQQQPAAPSPVSGTLPKDTTRAVRQDTTARATGFEQGRKLVAEFHGAVAHDGGISVLIATVPDPYDSHLDLSYDLYVESLRRAFENSGYVMDRFWIPGRDATSKDSAGTVPQREIHPGVILFREHRADTIPPRLQLLYLVGETPTSGIHKKALENALRERSLLDRAHMIRIVGPSFSGSALSLRRTLAGWLTAHEADSVRVISGSATSPAVASQLRLARVTYAATLHDDAVMMSVLRTIALERLGIRSIAFLHESTTGYGRTAADSSSSTGASPSDPTVLVIPFPLNISNLRSQVAANPLTKDGKSALPISRETDRLPMALRVDAKPKESPPVTSALTPPALDLELDEMVRTIRAREIQAVGLMATDIRDKLFLAELLHRRLPDVQLFTFESNVLYGRKEYQTTLRGMLIVSTYPLLGENQHWSNASGANGSDRVMLFGSDGAQGTYNAAAILLGDTSLVEYRGPISDGLDQPPVWITAVGAKKFVPYAVCRAAVTDTIRAPAQPDYANPERRKRALTADTTANCSAFKTDADGASNHLDRHTVSFLTWAGVAALVAMLVSGLLFYQRSLRRMPGASAEPEPIPVPVTKDNYGRHSLEERRTVEKGTLLVQGDMYALLLIIALLGMYLPVITVLMIGADALHLTHEMSLLNALIVVTWAAGGIILLWSLWYAFKAVWRMIVHTRRYQKVTRHYVRILPQRMRRPPDITVATDVSEKEVVRRLIQRYWWNVEIAGRGFVLLFGVAYLALTVFYAWGMTQLGGEKDMRFVQYFHRAIQLDTGLSPLIPLVLAGGGFAMWATWHLKRVRLLLDSTAFEESVRYGVAIESKVNPAVVATAERLTITVNDLRDRLILLAPNARSVVFLVMLAAIFAWLVPQRRHTLEDVANADWSSFDLLLWAGILASLGTTAWAGYRIVSIWRGLGACLNVIADTPLFPAFERLPRRMSAFSKPSLIVGADRDAVRVTAEVQWKHLQRIFTERRNVIAEELRNTLPKRADAQLQRIPLRQHSVFNRMQKLMDNVPEWTEGSGDQEARVKLMGSRLNEVAHILVGLWDVAPTCEEIENEVKRLEEAAASDKLPSHRNTSDEFRRKFAGSVGLWMRVAEEFAAVQTANYIEWAQQHLRELAFFLLLSMLITTALLSSIPFQPGSMVRVLFGFAAFGGVGAITYVMTSMNRDEVLSKLDRTKPGEITWNGPFITNVAMYVILPVLALLSSEFPRLRAVMFAWTEPLLQTITKF
jgi:hypothetical protein